ncbi:MAG: (deoxy)nucleoside triphosphate pyrophosphohydrolase [Candidatus Faecivicinus sp.]
MIAVVAGIVIRDGLVMLCQRKDSGPEALKWEFPGGKLEPGETPEQALARELREELDIGVRVGRIYDARLTRYPEREVLLLFYRCELISGEPRCVDCSAVRWEEPARLPEYDLAPADAQVAAQLASDALGK